MNEQLIFNRIQAKEYLRLKETKFARFIRQGLIPKSIQKKGNHPFWTIRQMRLAAKQLHDLEGTRLGRKVGSVVRNHSTQQIEQMKRNIYGE